MVSTASTSRTELPSSAEPPIPPVRNQQFSFDEVPVVWFRDNPSATAALDAFNLIFPAGERFFIRSVKRFEGRVTDPTLKARMKGFYGQEAHHQRAHLEAAAHLEAHGFDTQTFLAFFEKWAFGFIEPRFSPEMRLAVTAACEHLTATLAEVALGTDVLEDAAPAMRDLLRWHAIEEIEHKDVAFEVLQQLDRRLTTRIGGMGIALGVFFTFWAVGTRHFARQQTAPRRRPTRQELARMTRNAWHVLKSVASYARPTFHPNERPSDQLAAHWRPTLSPTAPLPGGR